jgi:hypothetical protein
MKKMKIVHVLKGTFMVVMTTLFIGLVASCKNDDDDNIPGSGKSHKVVFKAIASSGSDINVVCMELMEIRPQQAALAEQPGQVLKLRLK